jgi:hypothetical protein
MVLDREPSGGGDVAWYLLFVSMEELFLEDKNFR